MVSFTRECFQFYCHNNSKQIIIIIINFINGYIIGHKCCVVSLQEILSKIKYIMHNTTGYHRVYVFDWSLKDGLR